VVYLGAFPLVLQVNLVKAVPGLPQVDCFQMWIERTQLVAKRLIVTDADGQGEGVSHAQQTALA